MIRYYFAAQDIHERANSTHFDYRQIAEQLKNTDLIFRIQRLDVYKRQRHISL